MTGLMRTLFYFVLMVVLFVSCELNESSGEPTPKNFLTSNILSVEPGKSAEVEFLGNSQNSRFMIETEGKDNKIFDYEIKRIDGKVKFDFESKNMMGQQKYKITSFSDLGTETNMLTVRSNDHYILDMDGDMAGLIMRYTNTYDFIYDDSGTRADSDMSAYKPKTDAGSDWYSLGSRIINAGKQSDDNLRAYPAIMLKDNSKEKDLMRHPVDYELIWNDGGSEGDRAGSIWRPIPAQGYAALGVVVAGGYSKPALNEVMTVKKEYTTDGDVGELVWKDSGSGARLNISLYKASVPRFPVINDASRAPMVTETVIGCPVLSDDGDKSCENKYKSVAKLLLYKKLVIDKGYNDVQPKLTDRSPYVGYDTYHAIIKIPFTATGIVKRLIEENKRYEIRNYVERWPFVYIQRQERYNNLAILDNSQGSEDSILTYTKATSVEKTKEKSFGGSIGVEFTYETSGGVGVVQTTQSVSFSAEFNWNITTSRTYGSESGIEAEVTVPAGKYVQVVQIKNFFNTFRLDPDGTKTTIGVRADATGNIFKVLQYPIG